MVRNKLCVCHPFSVFSVPNLSVVSVVFSGFYPFSVPDRNPAKALRIIELLSYSP